MRIKSLVFIILTIILMGCKPSPTTSTIQPTLTPGSNGYPVSTTGIGYPSQGEITPNNPGYPVSATTTLATMVPTGTPNAVLTPVIIASIEHTTDGLEVITIKNISQTDQDISLFSLINPLTQDLYPFPDKSTLSSGQSIVVFNGAGATYPSGQKWLDKGFLTTAGDSIQLLNQAARIIYTYTYYP